MNPALAFLARNPELILAGLLAFVAIIGLAIIGIVIATLPGYILLAIVATAAFYLAMRVGGLRLNRKGRSGGAASASSASGRTRMNIPGPIMALGIVLSLVLVFLVVAPKVPAMENANRPPELRLQDVKVHGVVTINPELGREIATFSQPNVDWRDSRLMAWSFFAPWCVSQSEPITINARLVSTDGAQEDYPGSFKVGTVCDGPFSLNDRIEKDYAVTIPRVVPGEYTIYVSASQPDGDRNVDIAQYTVGVYTIQHREGN